MTVPEENRPKTDTTDEVVGGSAQGERRRTPGPSSRTMREALDEAGVDRNDFEDK
ncbi:hypothetical protein ACFY0F_08575 [Streptomyces sp. NPDC001544]|uniref:hypothetical protein n=1 Tax=Streptomyces sp. NPDC001544 TaxID=3364584 RepID=UPI00368B1D13